MEKVPEDSHTPGSWVNRCSSSLSTHPSWLSTGAGLLSHKIQTHKRWMNSDRSCSSSGWHQLQRVIFLPLSQILVSFRNLILTWGEESFYSSSHCVYPNLQNRETQYMWFLYRLTLFHQTSRMWWSAKLRPQSFKDTAEYLLVKRRISASLIHSAPKTNGLLPLLLLLMQEVKNKKHTVTVWRLSEDGKRKSRNSFPTDSAHHIVFVKNATYAAVVALFCNFFLIIFLTDWKTDLSPPQQLTGHCNEEKEK